MIIFLISPRVSIGQFKGFASQTSSNFSANPDVGFTYISFIEYSYIYYLFTYNIFSYPLSPFLIY